MNRRGVTLIELLIVVGVISIMLAVAAFQFQGWQAKYTKENQVKTLYADLVKARTLARGRNRMLFFRLSAGDPDHKYDFYLDANNTGKFEAGVDTRIVEISQERNRYAMVTNGAVDPVQIDFDKKGVCNWDTGAVPDPFVVIRIDDPDASSGEKDLEYDCLVMEQTRINLGKWDDADNECKD